MKKLLIASLLSSLSILLTAQSVDMSLFHGMAPRNIGPAGMSGRVTDIEVVLEDTDIIYLGTAAGGVWKSENAGHTWRPIFDDQPAASVGDIAVYQKNPNILYVGTGEGNPRNSQNSGWGMFKSLDGGRTWRHLGLELTRQIHRVIVHPDDPDVVITGVSGASWGDSEHRGIYKTTDGGETWEKVLYIDERTGCADLVMDPYNPNRLLAAMWEHRREPWFFTSGGPGSGLYLSEDGGETWTEVREGLPQGELGRIGLSFAPSKPGWVYAYVEAKDNAVFRSTDGGLTWEQRSKPKEKNIGGRPFYYADIYVDVKNENRVYSIATEVTVTEDGGKSWSVFAPGNKIHTDHHAWWAHPTDPDFLMIGHDGGFNITHDRGDNWWFADNLPLAQFYHVRVDNEVPYNIVGGLQDNGSWIGPSQVRFKGGIRNLYWQRLSVGDGFDVVPDPLQPDYGYAMGQAGSLVRYHRPSGQLLRIKPVHPAGEYLRFNWNSGIAIDPHDQKTIYYGSQYLHKSEDHGASWTIISPDLTTNDSTKQKFLESGGLTYDATGAENHTTIITIAPSAREKGVIWVGTDDGNVQVTRDGGQSWTNVRPNIKGVPEGTWVAQIQVSPFVNGQAFVVFDDHRRDNWEPYLYYTPDYGRSWRRLTDSDDVRGYVYCFAQDPVDPRLYFCGTEFGLYVSFDAGGTWNRWTEGYPTVPTRDMVIHPREHDLVIGTFGRAFWILDDIRPLRLVALQGPDKFFNQDLVFFPAPDAYLFNIGESIGYRHGKVGDALYNGENRPYGALFSYYLKEVSTQSHEEDPLQDSVKIEIISDSTIVRTLYQSPRRGVNRINWELDRDAPRRPNQAVPEKPKAPRGGMPVTPGLYKVRVSYQGHLANGQVTVLPDPLLDVTPEAMAAKDSMIQAFYEAEQQATAIMDRIRAYEKDLNFIMEKLPDEEKYEALHEQIKAVKEELKTFKERIVDKEVKGIYGTPAAVVEMLGAARSHLQSTLAAPTPNQTLALRQAQAAVEGVRADFARFEQRELNELRETVSKLDLGLLKG